MKFSQLKETKRNSLERELLISAYIRKLLKSKSNQIEYDEDTFLNIKDGFRQCGNCEFQFSILNEELHKLFGIKGGN